MGPPRCPGHVVPRMDPKPDCGFFVIQWLQEAASFMAGIPKPGSR